MTEQTEPTELTELPWQTMIDRWLPDDVLRPTTSSGSSTP